MKFSEESLNTIFAKNRTEELGLDVWKHFVVPLFYDKLDLAVARKPRLFIGGRGCGKTMLLRYLSHESSFSKDRKSIPDEAIEHIGLYWRVDTQFAVIMNERGLPADVWHSAFNHLLALFLGAEILKSLQNIASSQFCLLKSEDLLQLTFDRFSAFDPGLSGGLGDVLRTLETRIWEFESWVANVRKSPEPLFLPGVRFLMALISHIRSALPSLSSALYFVYVDEFENLLPYQQQILNTYLKHSEMPLIFNIAMKRHAFETIKTVGVESIQNIADFRKYELDNYLFENDFPVFAAEVLFLNLALANVQDVPIDVEKLQTPTEINSRRNKTYQDRVLQRIRGMFPGLSHEELAKQVFENDTLTRKLQERLKKALDSRHSTLKPEAFYRRDLPEATIIVPALIHRARLTPETILNHLDLLAGNKPNNFTGEAGWIHNNFIGCLLWLYESHSTACLFYSGFDTFCLLAHGNLRHFLEICHISLNQISKDSKSGAIVVPPQLQAKAARQASADFLNEIPAFGRWGDRLHTFVFRLGLLFALAHRRPTQSEPEQCHFAVTSGSKLLEEADIQFLREAEKWSVLFEEEETKIKNEYQRASFEYVLNPIYSPYFNITFRKKRKLELSVQDLEILIHGSFDKAKELLRRYSKQWQIEGDVESTPFFRFTEDQAE